MSEPSGSFDFEIPEHVPLEELEHWLNLIRRNAELEALGPFAFRASCSGESAVQEVGRTLFNTGLARSVRVVAVSGIARAQASAYPHPSSRAERKKYRG